MDRKAKKLITKSIKGDTDAFGKVVTLYQSNICAVTYSITGDINISEDLAQETFITAWQKLHTLEKIDKFLPWICSIARNLSNNWHRKAAKQKTQTTGELADQPAPKDKSDQHLLKEQCDKVLWESINKLEETYRMPLVMYYRSDKSIKQVAQSLELTEQCVRQRLSRARKMLRGQMAKTIEQMLQNTGPGALFSAGVITAIISAATPQTAAAATALSSQTAPASAATSTATTSTAGGFFSSALAAMTTVAGKITTAAIAAIIIAAAVTVTIATQAPPPTQDAELATIETPIEQLPPEAETLHLATNNTEPAPPLPTETKPTSPTPEEFDESKIGSRKDEPVKCVYVTRLTQESDKIEKEETWFKNSVGIKTLTTVDNTPQTLIIENNTDHIEIFYSKNTAELDYAYGKEYIESRYKQHLANYIESARKEDTTFTEFLQTMPNASNIVQQINNDKIVYTFNAMHESSGFEIPYTGKCIIEPETLLVEKIQMSIDHASGFDISQLPDNANYPGSLTLTAKYSQIPDSVFDAPDIPKDFEIKISSENTIDGLVTNEQDQPIEGCKIQIRSNNREAVATQTDTEGTYRAMISRYYNNMISYGYHNPVVIIATHDDHPYLIGVAYIISDKMYDDFVEKVANKSSMNIFDTTSTVTIADKSRLSFQTTNDDGEVITKKIMPISAISGTHIVMTKGGIIDGFVTDSYGVPISDATISLGLDIELDGKPSPRIYGSFSDKEDFQTQTDEAGYYVFSNVPKLWRRCYYDFKVTAANHINARENFGMDGYLIDRRLFNDPNSLFESCQQDFTLFAKSNVTIRGNIKDNYGNIVNNRSVRAFVGGKRLQLYSKLDDEGNFEIKNCPRLEGLSIRTDLKSPTKIPGDNNNMKKLEEEFISYPNITTEVDLIEDVNEYELEIVTPVPELTVEAFVYKPDGQPYPGYTLQLRCDDGMVRVWRQSYYFDKLTDADGYCEFDQVPLEEGLKIKTNWTDAEKFKEMNRYKSITIPIDAQPGQKLLQIEIYLEEK